jgi:hypothetical protein
MLRLTSILFLCAVWLMESQMLACGMTLDELEHMPHFTPEKLVQCFKDFEYEFHVEVQDADTFLHSQKGDCDDFAIVAAEVLSSRGYTPRLVTVRMVERGGYLDYNARKSGTPITPCGERLSEIAVTVGKSFHREWSAVYEFKYDRSRQFKRLVNHILTNPDFGRLAQRQPPAQETNATLAGSDQAAGTKD